MGAGTKDMGMRGNMAKGLHKFCPTMCDKLARNGNIMIMINQVRVAGTTFTGAAIYKEPGGDAPRYYASVKVRFGKRVPSMEFNSSIMACLNTPFKRIKFIKINFAPPRSDRI